MNAKSMPGWIPYQPSRVRPEEGLQRVQAFQKTMDGRRSVRTFARDPVPQVLVETILSAASTAPSGAHKQPWTFVAVSDPEIKAKIREAAEVEEKINYESRFSEEWKKDLEPLGTDFVKTHLTDAPWVIAVFAQSFGLTNDGARKKHYYVQESVGIATGMLIAAATVAGLATLVHTPSPMGFLAELLKRPENEKAFAVIPLGYPAPDCRVPDLKRKGLDQVSRFFPP